MIDVGSQTEFTLSLSAFPIGEVGRLRPLLGEDGRGR